MQGFSGEPPVHKNTAKKMSKCFVFVSRGSFGRCRIFEVDSDNGKNVTEFGDDRVFNDLRYTINSDKLHALGWKEVRLAGAGD